MAERPKCVEICALPSNATGEVYTKAIGKPQKVGLITMDPNIRRYRIFENIGRVNSVIVPNHMSGGVHVPPDAEACRFMEKYYNERRGSSGGGIDCPYANVISGSGTPYFP